MIAGITWRPGIGDPTLTGWVITIAYGAAAALCFRCGRRVQSRRSPNFDVGQGRLQKCKMRNAERKTEPQNLTSAALITSLPAGESSTPSDFSTDSDHRQALPWLVFAGALLLLGLNKQLDLQTLFIQMGREIAVAAGWYGERRRLQMVFMLVLGAVVLSALLALIWKRRQFFRQHPLSLLGSLLLVFYVLLRAAAIDHADEVAGLQLDDRRWMAGMELSGILLLAGAGVRAAKPPRNRASELGVD